ncbi:MAG: hypothetical protein GTO02_04235 [Candidatus Dadabacteria bacterium]|nr:hypothetical protein [Candidatus Dadabacteria bacterium]NIQ13630.1 hypothetical protein [Candidatus Dadabacteria bacterium]
MLNKNIFGGIVIVAIVLSIIGYAISLKISMDWGSYFKILAAVAVIAATVSIITHIIPSRN